MQLALVDMQRRVQSRVPLPWIQPDPEWLRAQQAAGRPLVRFADIPLDWTDFRLTLRQTADILLRFDALEPAEHERIGALTREGNTLEPLVERWYAASSGVDGNAPRTRMYDASSPNLDQVLVLAVRPFLARCVEVLAQRPELSAWNHGYCPFCGWEPDFAVVTPKRGPPAHLRAVPGAVGVRRVHVPVLRERGPIAHHVVRDARRPLPRLRLRRLPPLSQGVRRAECIAAGDGVGGFDRDAAARRGSDAGALGGAPYTKEDHEARQSVLRVLRDFVISGRWTDY